jgi:hypothetical protein
MSFDLPQADFSIEFQGQSGGGQWVVIGAFVLLSLAFVPMGVLIARYFEVMPPLRAYLVNVLGAIAGTAAFVGISFAFLSPPYWFAVGVIACLFMASMVWKWRVVLAAVGVALVGGAVYQDRGGDVLWSPYQRVSWSVQTGRLSPTSDPFVFYAPIFVNYEYHQLCINLGFVKDSAEVLRRIKIAQGQLPHAVVDTPVGFFRRYNLPYDFIRPKRVLIIAAGNGNEAAAALRHGAEEIDAVEIDPGILEVGRRLHPERPYDDPRVRVICDDARAFLERTDKRYDLIVMNAVDSHSQFASSANLRLDSYIFTVEFFQQVRRHLADNGLFALEFSGHHWERLPWSQQRLAEILWRVFGYRPPDDSQLVWGAGGPVFLIRAGRAPAETAWNPSVRVSTDDWPQFYLRGPMIPAAYLELIAAVVGLSALGLLLVWPRGMAGVDWHFVLLGAAFMLLEIKSISELSLVFGNTWMVNSFVIGAILAAIAAANLVVLHLKAPPYAAAYALVFLSLGLGLMFPPGAFLGFDFAGRAALGCLRVALPIFGAGLVFASSFRRALLPPAALGWNLLGAMLGGLGEYLSLITGVQALGLIVIGLYGLSLVSLRGSHLKA